jgi:hypothetical protein
MIIDGDYQRDGAVCVRGAFNAAEIALATEAIEANLASLSPRAKRASPANDGAFIEDFCNWDRIPANGTFHSRVTRSKNRCHAHRGTRRGQRDGSQTVSVALLSIAFRNSSVFVQDRSITMSR